MIELKNITFHQYLNLEDRSEYDFAINYAESFLEPKDIFSIGSFTQLEFGLVKDLQQDISQGMTWDKMLEYMCLLTGKKELAFYNLSLLKIIQFRNYIVNEIKQIVEIENQVLSYDPSEDEIQAGIDKLSVFGVYSQLLSVANGDPLKVDSVRKMKYEDAFVFLCYQKMSSDFERDLIRIRTPKDA